MKNLFLFIAITISIHGTFGQQAPSRNLIIITLDGLRWQEVFKGAEERILFNKTFTKDTTIINKFWHQSTPERRQRLMPFLWKTVGEQGQLYGNRKYRNKVNCSNQLLFSYPGYSEMLVGFVDKRVKSNDKVENPNFTVLEFVHSHPGFHGQVAAFSSWDVIPFIMREKSSEIPVFSGDENKRERSYFRNKHDRKIEIDVTTPNDDSSDLFTFSHAFEYLKHKRPRLVFISFDETDRYAHQGKYDQYLHAAHQADQFVEQLWHWVQSQDDYQNQTTLLITTDHGRGKGVKTGWKRHSLLHVGSGQIWFAVIGPDTPALGEVKSKGRYYQKQIAKTAAAFLGLQYLNVQPVGEIITPMLTRQALNSLPVYHNASAQN